MEQDPRIRKDSVLLMMEIIFPYLSPVLLAISCASQPLIALISGLASSSVVKPLMFSPF